MFIVYYGINEKYTETGILCFVNDKKEAKKLSRHK